LIINLLRVKWRPITCRSFLKKHFFRSNNYDEHNADDEHGWHDEPDANDESNDGRHDADDDANDDGEHDLRNVRHFDGLQNDPNGGHEQRNDDGMLQTHQLNDENGHADDDDVQWHDDVLHATSFCFIC